jgi:hypothetical protein
VAERDALAMHLFNREFATYVRAMRQGDEFEGVRNTAIPNAVAVLEATIGDDDVGGDYDDLPTPPREPGGQYMYTVEVLFYIVEPMQRPSDEGFRFLSFANSQS